MTLEQVEPLICSRLADIKSAFMAVDPDGTGLVNTEEFRQVLENLLCISQNQLDTVLNEVRGSFTFHSVHTEVRGQGLSKTL